MPNSIVLDRDKTFTRGFWIKIFKQQGVELGLSTTYHAQTEGQSKAINNSLENFLRCFVGERPRDWILWVLLA